MASGWRICRCYDPRRMSSASISVRPRLAGVALGAAWTAILVTLAISGAGLVEQFWHAPGSPARAELTYTGDAALQARLDDASARLRAIVADVERLADEAKTALEQVTSVDPKPLQETLQRGTQTAATIDVEIRALRKVVADLPGEGPTAALEYGNAVLVRRAAILAALDSVSSLSGQWARVAAGAVETAHLTSLIGEHDTTVLAAAAQGRSRKYADALVTLQAATALLNEVALVRTQLIKSADVTVLDEWIARNLRYDNALSRLYAALTKSKGKNTLEVQAALREVELAQAQLPPDNRTIIVIVAEAARGGLNQAVITIEEAHARIDQALAETGVLATAEPAP
jgi:hypothetical protein